MTLSLTIKNVHNYIKINVHLDIVIYTGNMPIGAYGAGGILLIQQVKIQRRLQSI